MCPMTSCFPCCCMVCVREMDAGLVETCGKFSRILPPGCHCIMFPFETVAARISIKVRHAEFSCGTKTKDNVFVTVVIAVQYKVVESKVPSAHYKLTDPEKQIMGFVNDVIRSAMPRMNIDDAFASKDTLAEAVKNQLQSVIGGFGYEILACLVVDLNPDPLVKAAMNEINASQRMREAFAEKAEAEKILQVKAAEAEADSKYLSGLGVAKQRKAIVDGLKDTVAGFSRDIDGAGPQDVMDLLLVTQYFDMLRDIGGKSRTGNTMFLPHGPHSVQVLKDQLKNTFMPGLSAANAASVASASGKKGHTPLRNILIKDY